MYCLILYWLSLFLPIFSEEIFDIPGLNEGLAFRHFSGYINVSETRFHHYWFVESAHDPVNDPLILWLNGGPGCSSLEGLLNEHGPFKIHHNGSLYNNPYSWNQNASIIYLESPAGVGFSYSTDGNFTTNDEQTAEEHYSFVIAFYDEFPEFSNNEFFITGETYGGIYVPMLASRILDNQENITINLKGLAIGNGILDMNGANYEAQILFALQHNAISIEDFSNYYLNCGSTLFGNSKSSTICASEVINMFLSTLKILKHPNMNDYDINADCHHSANDSGFYPCSDGSIITEYLNREEVQKALNIHYFYTPRQWKICRRANFYKENWIHYKSQYENIQKALSAGIRVMIFNGDADVLCPSLGGQIFTQKIAKTLNLTSKNGIQSWGAEVGQLNGFVQHFGNDNILRFVSIKGAGHKVAYSNPKAAMKMFQLFIRNIPLGIEMNL